MNNFTGWMTLVLGIWFTITATISLYTDIKNHRITKWWRWVLDPRNGTAISKIATNAHPNNKKSEQNPILILFNNIYTHSFCKMNYIFINLP